MSADAPLISVITACFNANEYIEQCMKSVLGQTFDDYEYIVIDGGSTDGTTALIEQYRSHLSYYHSRPDRGISDAFNQGIAQARGRWIAFINADDCYADMEVLTSMAEILRQHDDADLVYGQVQIIQRRQSVVPISPLVGEVWRWREFRLRSTIPHPAAFTHRRYFERYGMFDENFRNALDYELYLRAGKDMQALFVPRLLAWMRDGGMSKDDAYRSYRESRQAQVKNAAFGRFTAWMVYLIYAVRVFITQLVPKR